MFDTAKEGSNGTFFCAHCLVRLEGEKDVVGLIRHHVYDIHRCPLCRRLHWAPHPVSRAAGVPRV